MGSGASNNVKPESRSADGNKRSKGSHDGIPEVCFSSNNKNAEKSKEITPVLEKWGRTENSAEEDSLHKAKIEDLEKEMEALQSTNLDLQEQVQALEERLQEVTSDQRIANTQDNSSDSLRAKDQCIEKQQNELKTVQHQLSVLKTRYRKKLKAVNAQLSEAKHEWSLQVFELKQEISHLTDENFKLREKDSGDALNGSFTLEDGRKSALEESCDSRMKIILELSNKVSDQDAKITALENKLREQNKLLEAQEKARSTSAKRRGSSRQNSTLEKFSLDYSNVPDDDTAELNELKSIAEEMKKLRKGKKKEKRRPVEIDYSNYREASGRSRDSGISSADTSAHRNFSSGGRIKKEDRVQSAASTMSAFSDDLAGEITGTGFVDDQDSWDESEIEEETRDVRRLELRQISAPKHKKKNKTSDYEYITNLLTDVESNGRYQKNLSSAQDM